jgi:putative heme iron utilization protein
MLKHSIAALLLGAVAVAPLTYAQAQTQPMSPTRAAAIHECGVLAGRYAETTYGNTEFYLYRSCMARHGQAE